MTEYTIKVKILDDGTRQTFNSNNKLHSFNDEPACVYFNGSNVWYKDGKCHRDNDEPAITCVDGSKFWYRNDKFHRDNDEPAITYANGPKYWYKNGIIYTPSSQTTTLCGKIVEIDGKKYKLTEV